MTSSRLTGALAALLGAAVLAFVIAAPAAGGLEDLGKALTKSKVKSIAKRQANAQITSRAPGLTVASAGSATAASHPAVFAQVAANGQLNAANSAGLTQANLAGSPNNGFYCFSALPFTPRGGNATVDWNGGDWDTTALLGLGENLSCPAGTDAFVDVRQTTGAGSEPTGFFVTFYR